MKVSFLELIKICAIFLDAPLIAGKIATVFNESLKSGDLRTEFKMGHVRC